MENLKLGDAMASASDASVVNNVEGQQPEQEPGQQLQSEDVDEIFWQMKETALIPNAVNMLDGLCKNGLVQEAMKMFGLLSEKGAIPEFCHLHRILQSSQAGRCCEDLQEEAEQWGHSKCKGGKLADVAGFCAEMFEARHSLNAATFVGLVDVCKTKGVEEGEKLCEELPR